MKRQREIKFRAFNKKDKRMFQVSPVWFEENNYFYNDYALCMKEEGCIIMQYTGLKDKKGKEIYEGDIVKRATDDCIYNIEFVGDLCGFNISWSDSEDCKIIGNIYKNPKLLKKKT